MKKTLALLLALCMMLMAFTACSGSSDDEGSTSDSGTSGTATSDSGSETSDGDVADSITL
ncbi:MAG: hypothetical protein LIO42_02180 [Oscillospiraceae bacterium]|nr:hypothetical protein [Oscillospiraceae bacterium]